MYKVILMMFLLLIGLTLVTNNRTVISAQAISSVSSGPVIQEAVNTGNPDLDKQINNFYSCISKITHEPQEPGKAAVDNCYFQIFGASAITLPSNETRSSVSNSEGNNQNSGHGNTKGNSGQIMSEVVHSKIVKQFK